MAASDPKKDPKKAPAGPALEGKKSRKALKSKKAAIQSRAEEGKKRLMGLEAAANKGSPEAQAQIETLKLALEQDTKELNQTDIDMKDASEDEDEPEKENKGKDLEIPGTAPPAGTTPPPAIEVEDVDMEPPAFVDEEDVVTVAQLDAANGKNGDEKIVGWRKAGWGKLVIVSSGPMNAQTFQIKSDGEVAEQVDPSAHINVGNAKNRFSERRDQDERYLYHRSQVVAIQGVAWKHDEKKFMNPLNALDPAMKTPKGRYPPTYVKVKWDIGGHIKKTWETRTGIRRLWGNKQNTADKVILIAAQYQAKRNDEWKAGQRKGQEVSPTPDPELPEIKTEPEPEPPAKTEKVPSKFAIFREGWCELKNLDPQKLDDNSEAQLVNAWTKSIAV
ncbi:MAG: hypothetical protein M1814_000477 [Vezdaea aestivalis]|nr:MAG: hypothetical protein M1814_000477 [Vezdaea aestivalis]